MDLVREVTTGMLDCGRSRLPYQIIPIASKGVLNILALSVHQEVSKFGFPKNYNQMKEVNWTKTTQTTIIHWAKATAR